MEKPTVLIIDNDATIQKALADLLEAKGYASLGAANGAEGLALLKTRPVALALIDLDLPDRPGLDILSSITAEYPDTTALVLTGKPTVESAIEATNRGAVSYLVKPCEDGQLMRHINRAIEKKHKEEVLRRSERFFRSLLETAPTSMLIANAEHEILMVNRQFEQMFGYERGEILGRPVEMLIPSRFDRHREYGQAYMAKPQPRTMGKGRDLYGLRKDGSELPVEIGLSPLETPDGLVVSAMIVDLSQRKQDEAARLRHIHFLECLERINRAIRKETDVERMLWNVVKTVFSIFACDRAWLLYPCDPDAPSFRVPVEVCRPAYPGAHQLNRDVPMASDVARDIREALASEEPLAYAIGQEKSVKAPIAEQFAIQSQMLQALYPKTGKPWVFGMHQCSYPRIWTEAEKGLFKEIARRVTDGLSSLLFLRDLRESEARFSALVNQAADAILLFDMDGKLLDVNQRACDSLGFTKATLLTMNILDIDLQSADKDRIRRVWTALRTDRPLTSEGLYRRKDGTVFPVEVRLGPLLIGDNRVILALARDITERKQAEAEGRQVQEALAKSRRMLAHILDSVPQSIFWKDRNSRYLGCNEIFTRNAGLDSPEEVIGKTDFDLPWQHDESEKYRADDRDVIEQNRSKAHIIQTQLQANGKRVWIDATKIPLVDETGRVYGVLGVYEDITDRRKAEQDREKLQAQLTQAQKMESVGRLAGGVAHDFNNMLSVILGRVELALLDTDPDQPHFAAFQDIRRAAQRSANLTRQLLAFARKQTVAPRVINLNQAVEGMLQMLRRLIGEDIDLLWLPGADLWPIRMDPSQVDQIMANLAVNARDAIDGIGKVTIETQRAVLGEAYCAAHAGFAPGEYVLLTVSDDGCGMDRETLGKLFEPFFTTKDRGKGTGLGLAMVYGIVKQNNGFINVYSEPDVGTTFKIYLPRHRGEAEEQTRPAGTMTSVARGHETVLLVEDEPAILKITKGMLDGQGYTVLVASTPGEAMDLAQQHGDGIHLLITDVIMPEMNGRDLAGRLLVRFPNMKCLFMSGYTADVIAHHGVLDPGAHFIAKPFTVYDMAKKVREVLDSRQ